jgi:hypothetical protein
MESPLATYLTQIINIFKNLPAAAKDPAQQQLLNQPQRQQLQEQQQLLQEQQPQLPQVDQPLQPLPLQPPQGQLQLQRVLCGSGETGAPSLTVHPPAGTDHIFSYISSS